jgi:periplasmic copper chaperone A
MKKLLMVAGVAALMMGVAACGDDSDSGSGTEGVTISGMWARTSPMMATAGAAYMLIESGEGDTLTAASVDPSIAAKVEIHETRLVETETTAMMNGTAPADGAMEMVPIDELDIPAGGSVSLEPGGYHIMLLDLPAPLELGSEVELTLSFETAGDITLTVPVRDEAP